MGSRHGEAGLPAGEFSEHARALDDLVAVLAGVCQFAEVVGNCRGVDHQGALSVGRDAAAVVIVMHIYPLSLQLVREFGGGAVVAGDAASLELAETGEGAHPYAAYAYEVYVVVVHLAIL